MRWIGWALVAAGCGGAGAKDATDATGPSGSTEPTTSAGGCADPTVNPWAGTCVETFLAGCFDPEGACTGTWDLQGNTELTWANGAQVITEVDLSQPLDPSVTTDLFASDGGSCATGTSELGAGGCASLTTYVRTSDGAEQTWCIRLNGDITVTCPDGTEVSVTAAESEAAQGCEYGSGEPCTMTGPGM